MSKVAAGQQVIVLNPRLEITALHAHRVIVGGVGRRLLAEQVERHREVEVEVLLDRRQVDRAEAAHVVGLVLLHQVAGALDDALHAQSPTNMWCASSISMKRQERDSGSKPNSASEASWYLPSRSVK